METMDADRCIVCFVRFPDVWNPYLWPNCTKCLRRVHLDCLNGRRAFSSAAVNNYVCRSCVGYRTKRGSSVLVPRQAGVSDANDSGGMQLPRALTAEDSTGVIKVSFSDGVVADGGDTMIMNGCPNEFEPGNDALRIFLPKDTKSGDAEETLEISDDEPRGKSLWDKKTKKKLPPEVLVTIQTWAQIGRCHSIDIMPSLPELLLSDGLTSSDEESLKSGTSDDDCHSVQLSSSVTDNHESGGSPGSTDSMLGHESGLASAGRPGFAARESVFKASYNRKHAEEVVRAACLARETADAARSFADQTAIQAARAATKAKSALNSAAVTAKAANYILQNSLLEEVSDSDNTSCSI